MQFLRQTQGRCRHDLGAGRLMWGDAPAAWREPQRFLRTAPGVPKVLLDDDAADQAIRSLGCSVPSGRSWKWSLAPGFPSCDRLAIRDVSTRLGTAHLGRPCRHWRRPSAGRSGNAPASTPLEVRVSSTGGRPAERASILPVHEQAGEICPFTVSGDASGINSRKKRSWKRWSSLQTSLVSTG